MIFLPSHKKIVHTLKTVIQYVYEVIVLIRIEAMPYAQQYLDTLGKQQRGELWMQGVLKSEPDYNIQELRDIWTQTQNTCETYEQQADRMKALLDALNQGLKEDSLTFASTKDLFDAVERLGDEILKQPKSA